jgi:hypothetical protein
MSSAGFKRPGVECTHCKKEFALSWADKGASFEKWPDPLVAQCVFCGQSGTYQKSEVGTLVSVGY